MLAEVVAVTLKLEEATKEAGVLLNPEAAAALSPVDAVTINRLVVEATSLAMKAAVVEVSNQKNTEVEEVVLKAEAEAEDKRWETVGVVSAILLTVNDKNRGNKELREEVMESQEINIDPTMNPHQSQSSRVALAVEAATHVVEENTAPCLKNNTKDRHKIMLIAEPKAIMSNLPMKNLGINKATTISDLIKNTSPTGMISMSNLPDTNRIKILLEKVITIEEEIEAAVAVVAVLKKQTTEVATILNTVTTIKDKDMEFRTKKMKSPSPRITAVEEVMAQNEEACECEVGSKTEAVVIEEASEDTAVAIKKEAATKLAVDTVAIEATSEELRETSMEKEVDSSLKEVERLNEAVATATTKTNQKTKQNISTAIKMD